MSVGWSPIEPTGTPTYLTSGGDTIVRYSVSFTPWFGHESTAVPPAFRESSETTRVATGKGPHKAVALATSRLMRLHPDYRFSEVTIDGAEYEWVSDPDDIADYHEIA